MKTERNLHWVVKCQALYRKHSACIFSYMCSMLSVSSPMRGPHCSNWNWFLSCEVFIISSLTTLSLSNTCSISGIWLVFTVLALLFSFTAQQDCVMHVFWWWMDLMYLLFSLWRMDQVLYSITAIRLSSLMHPTPGWRRTLISVPTLRFTL